MEAARTIKYGDSRRFEITNQMGLKSENSQLRKPERLGEGKL